MIVGVGVKGAQDFIYLMPNEPEEVVTLRSRIGADPGDVQATLLFAWRVFCFLRELRAVSADLDTRRINLDGNTSKEAQAERRAIYWSQKDALDYFGSVEVELHAALDRIADEDPASLARAAYALGRNMDLLDFSRMHDAFGLSCVDCMWSPENV